MDEDFHGIAAGKRGTVALDLPGLYDGTALSLRMHVVRGSKAGPALFVCAAVHGDELNGVEIVRRLLALPELECLRGSLLAVPIANPYGFFHRSRYLPDRRDLNRSFPGHPRGSLASRLAHLLMQEMVGRSTHGIDLHSGALHRSHWPHVRADLHQPGSRRLAEAFGTLVLHSVTPEQSLRQAAARRGVPVLLFEGGEALRFDPDVITAGLQGVVNVMRSLGMLPGQGAPPGPNPCAGRARWIRAAASGVVHAEVTLGQGIARGQLLGRIADPLGKGAVELLAPCDGTLIGMSRLPLVHAGEALFQLAVEAG